MRIGHGAQRGAAQSVPPRLGFTTVSVMAHRFLSFQRLRANLFRDARSRRVNFNQGEANWVI